MDVVEGTWIGRLIDVGGFEGEVTLTLQGGKGAVEGVFEAVIDGQHYPTRLRGRVSGAQKGNSLALVLDVGQRDTKVAVSLDGDVFKTRRGDLAACGVYAVSARQSSALMGGVISIRHATPGKAPVDNFRTGIAEVQGSDSDAAPRAAVAAKPRARSAAKPKGTKSGRSKS